MITMVGPKRSAGHNTFLVYQTAAHLVFLLWLSWTTSMVQKKRAIITVLFNLIS